jgi:hypothetical protein
MGPPDSGNFGYIPGKPSIELADGSLKASLLSSPAAAVLAFQAVLQASQDAVDAAQNAIPNEYPDAGSVSLSPAQLDDTTASLTVAPTNGNAHTFGPNTTAGPDSYRVVFSETLTSAEKLAAIGAFRGQAGVLKLTFEGTLTLDESASVESAGDLAEEAKALAPKKPEEKKSGGGFFGKKKDPDPPPAPPPDLAACAAAVDRAIAGGRLKLTVVRTPNVSDALARKVESAVRASAAQKLLDKLVQMGADAIYISSFAIRQKLSDSERISFRIERDADPAELLEKNGGGRLVTEAGAPISEPER